MAAGLHRDPVRGIIYFTAFTVFPLGFLACLVFTIWEGCDSMQEPRGTALQD